MKNLLTSTTAILASAALFAAGLMFQSGTCTHLNAPATLPIEKKLAPVLPFLRAHGTALTATLLVPRSLLAQQFLRVRGTTTIAVRAVLKWPPVQRFRRDHGTE